MMRKNELRKDPISGNWTIIINRKPDIAAILEKAQIREREHDAGVSDFCEGREHETPSEIAAIRHSGSASNEPGWNVRVIPEKYPVLQIHGELENRGVGLYDTTSGIGAHEIIIESPRAGEFFPDFSLRQFESVFSIYKERMLDLKRDPRFRYVLLHKAHDEDGEQLKNHSFSHLIATPRTPLFVKIELQNAKTHYAYKERCLFCDIVHQEKDTQQRIVLENDVYIALAPFASRSPFQLMILPKRHETFYEWNNEPHPLAAMMQKLFRTMARALGNIRYIMVLHSGPNIATGKQRGYWRTLEKDYHWHIELTPQMTSFHSFELGSGFQVNPISPEIAAEFLRQAATNPPVPSASDGQ